MRSDGSPASAESDSLVLAAARIAEDLIVRCSPSEEAVFAFAAAVVRAAQSSDRHAAPLAFELAAGLLDNVPTGRAWSDTHGRLSTTKLFAWLLLQSQPVVAGTPETHDSRPIRETPLSPKP